MKLYRYDHKTLSYVKIPWFRKYIIFFLMMFSCFLALKGTEEVYHHYFETEKVLLVECENEFSEERLIEKIKEFDHRFPWIVLAQSRRETGYYKSPICKENFNLFGMKEAKLRLNKAQGTSRNHAYYLDWEESVEDYMLWASAYTTQCKTEEQYFQVLENYAESETYVQDLKNDIKRNNLKQLFE